jgi:predicted O-methyltransferase YrrM
MRRKFSHWTPTYIRDRLLVFYDERKHPTHPWLTRDAVGFLSQVIKSADVGLEFGSGRSTIWFASRMSRLTSIEDNPYWHAKVSRLIEGQNLAKKVDYRFREAKEQYVADAINVADESVDVCLVDGSYRDECAIRVLGKVRRGGLLVVDNVNWYLPSDTISPSSRRRSDGCASPAWEEFAVAVQNWRRYWTSNGVTDTCIWFKP